MFPPPYSYCFMIELGKGRKIKTIRQNVRGSFVGEFAGTHRSSPYGLGSLGLFTAVCRLLLMGGRGGDRPLLPALLCVRLLWCQKGARVSKWAWGEVEAESEMRSNGEKRNWCDGERDPLPPSTPSWESGEYTTQEQMNGPLTSSIVH